MHFCTMRSLSTVSWRGTAKNFRLFTRQAIRVNKNNKAQRFYFRCAFALPYNYLIPKFLRYCSFIRLKLSSLISCSILQES